MRSGLLALLQHRDRHLTEPLAQLGRVLEQLAEPDRAREPRGARPDDQHADLDPIVFPVGHPGDVVARIERRR